MPNRKLRGFKRASPKNLGLQSRPIKRKLWPDESMEAAMSSVTKGQMSANKAADLFGVPRSTLKDRLSGRVVHGTKPGPKPYLTRDEEQELSTYLIKASSMGLGKTRRDVKCIVGSFVKNKGTLKSSTVSNGWWEKFLKRNPALSLRSGDSTAGVRLDAMSVENMKAYFDLLEEVYNEFDFQNHPEAIYNMDETGVPLEPRPPKVVARRGEKKVRCRTSGQKAQITVIGCGSATGQILPPFIIFAAKKLNHLWMKDEVIGSRYGVSDKGWVDQGLFYSWLKNHFLPNAASHRPLLLLLDGHSSHFEPKSIEFARENNIIIFCLPPHTTHECQPLDVGLFGPLKKYWREECHKFYQGNASLLITKLNFNRVFRTAWMKAVSPSNVSGGFRKSGVFPFNRDAVTVLNKDNGDGDNDASTNDDGHALDDTTGESSGESQRMNDDGGIEDERTNGSEAEGAEVSGSLEKSRGGGNPSIVDTGNTGDTREFGDKTDFDEDGAIRNLEDLSATTCTDHSPLSVEEEVRFIRRYEEGYDLYDEKYEAWLKHHHPEALQTYCKSGNPVAPLTSQHRSDTQISSPSTSSESDMPTPITPAAKHQTSRSTTSNTSLATTPKMPKSTSTVTRSPLADLVNLPANDRGSKSVNTGHARVLTSQECLQMLKEKEEKKKQVQLEKERRKLEREMKKKQKEQEEKLKAEAKAKRAAEREEAKAKQEAAKAAKQAARLEKTTKSSVSGTKRTSPNEPRASRVTKKSRKNTTEAEGDADQCCVCFGSYHEDIDTGREWIQCSCERWLHEDCVDDDEVDASGKVCPLC